MSATEGSPEWRFPIEPGHIMLFARAIGDPNPAYVDPGHGTNLELGGVVAPPTFLTAQFHFDPAFTMRPIPGVPWLGSGRDPSGLSDRGEGRPGVGSMQGEQHYHYHRALKSGDRLTRTYRPGTSWEKEGRRGGRLVFTDRFIEWRDERGDLVVTERGVSVRPSQVPPRKEV